MNALQVFENRTNDRFLSIAPRFSAPSGPGNQATWQELDVHASVTPGLTPRLARRASVVGSLIRMSRATAAAAAGLSLGWLLTTFIATLSGADGIRILSALLFASAWIYVGLAAVAGRWMPALALIGLALVLFALAVAGPRVGTGVFAAGFGLQALVAFVIGALRSRSYSGTDTMISWVAMNAIVAITLAV